MLTQNSDLLQDNWEAINDFENNHSSIIIPSLGKNILTFIFNLLGTLGIYSFFYDINYGIQNLQQEARKML